MRRKGKGSSGKAFVWLVIAVVCFGAGILIMKNGVSQAIGNTSDPIVTIPEYEDNTKVTTDFSIIQDGLCDMGFLITEEYSFEAIETYTKDKKIAFLTSEATFSYSYEGVVEAGVNFSDITVDVNEETKEIEITVPKSEIKDISIDEDSFKKFEEEDHLWNRLELEDYNEAQKDFKKRAIEKAEERGVLEKADENAKKVIGNFVEQLVDKSEYSIVYKEA
jgi:hypothetical protein